MTCLKHGVEHIIVANSEANDFSQMLQDNFLMPRIDVSTFSIGRLVLSKIQDPSHLGLFSQAVPGKP